MKGDQHTYGGVIFEETGEQRNPHQGEWYLYSTDIKTGKPYLRYRQEDNTNVLTYADFKILCPLEIVPQEYPIVQLEFSSKWKDSENYTVYLLKINSEDDTQLYAGHTGRDMDIRMEEHIKGNTQLTKDKNPELLWSHTVSNNRLTAALAELGLKYLIKERKPHEVMEELGKYDVDVSNIEISIAEQIYNTLKDSAPLTVNVISKLLDKPGKHIRVVLNRNTRFIKVGQVRSGTLWGLTAR